MKFENKDKVQYLIQEFDDITERCNKLKDIDTVQPLYLLGSTLNGQVTIKVILPEHVIKLVEKDFKTRLGEIEEWIGQL